MEIALIISLFFLAHFLKTPLFVLDFTINVAHKQNRFSFNFK